MHVLQASQKILCRYTNPTTRIQIIKISNIPNWSFERSVMPQGSILFEAYQEARLEIHTSEMMSAILSDVIPCSQLIKNTEALRKCPQQVLKTA